MSGGCHHHWRLRRSRLSTVIDDERADLEAQLSAANAELDRILFLLDVVGTVDLDTGLLNRNGIFESIQRAQRWLVRRGDIYGVMFVDFPHLDVSGPADPEFLEVIKHLSATIAAGVRDVDEVGRSSENSFAAVLANLDAGSLEIVAERVTRMLTKVTGTNGEPIGPFRIGGVEVLSPSHTSGTVLETAQRMAAAAADNATSLSTI
jgi:GGDEF domain-containing protein